MGWAKFSEDNWDAIYERMEMRKSRTEKNGKAMAEESKEQGESRENICLYVAS